MGKYNSFVGQQWIWIALMITGGISSLLMGILMPLKPINERVTSAAPTFKNNHHNETISDRPLVAQQNQAYNQVINQLQRSAQEVRSAFVPKQFQGKVFSAVQVSSHQKVVALTFDDGPAPKSTDQILKILKKNNTKATFFMVGSMVQKYPQSAKQVVAEGHAVANHTWTHGYKRLDEKHAAAEINSTADIIYKTTGLRTSIFRPPGGFLNNGLVAYAKKKNYAVAMWSADSSDYRCPPAAKLASNVLKYVKPGGIVLLHDGGGDRAQTIKALPIIITNLRKQGFRFVTVSELLDLQTKQPVVAVKQKSKPSASSKVLPKKTKV